MGLREELERVEDLRGAPRAHDLEPEALEIADTGGEELGGGGRLRHDLEVQGRGGGASTVTAAWIAAGPAAGQG